MEQYKKLVRDILEEGHESDDRTRTGIYYLFGEKMEFDLQDGFPLLTLRDIYFTGIKDEMLWMLSGSTNIQDLPERTQQIWDREEWMYDPPAGHLGPSYGKQFRRVYDGQSDLFGPSSPHKCFDQIEYLIDNIQEKPNSRRHVLSLWRQPDMSKIPLPCCHGTALQFNVRDMKYLDCAMYARSQDVGLGMVWNIAAYAMLTHMIAQVTGYHPGTYTHMGGNCHIYKNHVEQAETLLGRECREKPTLELNEENEDFDSFTAEDIQIKDYNPHSKIEFPVAV